MRTVTRDSSHLYLGPGTIGSALAGASAISFLGRGNWTNLISSSAGQNRVVYLSIDGSSTAFALGVNATGTPDVPYVTARSQVGDSAQAAAGVSSIVAGTWYTIGVTVDFAADQIRIYVDGVLDSTTNVTFGANVFTPGTPTNSDFFGGSSANNGASASLEMFAFFRGDIGAAGHRAFHNFIHPNSIRPDLLVAAWSMNSESNPSNGTGDVFREKDISDNPALWLLQSGTVSRADGNTYLHRAGFQFCDANGDVAITHADETKHSSDAFSGSGALFSHLDEQAHAWQYNTAAAPNTGFTLVGDGTLRHSPSVAGSSSIAYLNSAAPSFNLRIRARLRFDGSIYNNHYLVGWGNASNGNRIYGGFNSTTGWHLGRSVSGATTVLTRTATLNVGQWYWLALEITKGFYRLFVDGVLVLQAVNNNTVLEQVGASGLCGFNSSGASTESGSTGGRWSDFRVEYQWPCVDVVRSNDLGGNAAYEGFQLVGMLETPTDVIVHYDRYRTPGADNNLRALDCVRVPKVNGVPNLSAVSAPIVIWDETASGKLTNNSRMYLRSDGSIACYFRVLNSTDHIDNATVLDPWRVYESVSTDGGATWPAFASCRDVTDYFRDPALEAKLAVGIGNGTVIRNGPHKGRWLAHGRYTVGGAARGQVVYTDNEGLTWTKGGIESANRTPEGAYADLPNGDLVAAVRDDWEQRKLVVRSVDGGITWTDPTYPSVIWQPSMEAEGCFAGCRAVNGHVVVTSPYEQIRTSLYLHRSSDGALTWRTPGSSDLGRIQGDYTIAEGVSGYSDVLEVNGGKHLMMAWLSGVRGYEPYEGNESLRLGCCEVEYYGLAASGGGAAGHRAAVAALRRRGFFDRRRRRAG